jgi:hypothetical protein
MTSDDDINDDEQDVEKKKKKKGDGDASGTERRTVSPEAFAFLSRVGATMEQISRVLSQWVHLKGENLVRALNDFARDVARASSQPQVQFDGKDVSIITSLFRSLTGKNRNPRVRPGGDSRPRGGPR